MPFQVPSPAVSVWPAPTVPEMVGTRRRTPAGPAATGPTVGDGDRGLLAVVAGDHDAHGRADVAGAERVGAVRRARDVGAVVARGVAALPLVGEVDRAGAGPRAGVGGQRLAVERRAGGRRACRSSAGGSTATLAPGTEVATSSPGAVGRGDLDHDRVADVGGRQVVGRAGGAGDVGAVRAVGVAALPLVRVGERVGAGPACRWSALSVEPSSSVPRDDRDDRVAGGAAWARRGLGRAALRAAADVAARSRRPWRTWSMSPGTSV